MVPAGTGQLGLEGGGAGLALHRVFDPRWRLGFGGWDFWLLVSGFWFLVSGFRFQVSGFWFKFLF